MKTSHRGHASLSGLKEPRLPTPWFLRWRAAPIFGYFALSAFFCFTIRTPNEFVNSLLLDDLVYLPVPFGLLIFGLTYQQRRFLYKTKKRTSQVWFQSAFLFLLAVLFAFPYQLAWNATSSSPVVLDLHGPAIRKYVSGGRSTSYDVTVAEKTLDRTLTFSVSHSYYLRLQPGDYYSERMYLGKLGIPYRWVWERP